MSTDLVWLTLLIAAGVFELWAIWLVRRDPGQDGTLTNLVRRVFRVDTVAGRIVFAAAWLGFAAWFLFHIVIEGTL